jgi:hypothetical protein
VLLPQQWLLQAQRFRSLVLGREPIQTVILAALGLEVEWLEVE